MTDAIRIKVMSPLADPLSGKQDQSAALDDIAGLSPSDDDILQRKAGAWTNRTIAQVKDDLSLAKGDVGLGNVDNTSDANKPISTATQTALNAKADDSELSAEATARANADNALDARLDTAEGKLSGIENGATANDTDAELRDRTTHTGEQAISTVTGLQAALDGKQAGDADLTVIAALTPADDDFLQRKGGGWTNRTVAQVKTDLGIDDAGDANLPTVVQTQLRPGDVLDRFTSSLTGAAEDAVDITDTTTTTDTQGSVLRITGAATIATRERVGLVAGRKLRVRAGLQRSTDPSDPAGDTVRVGIQWLNKNKAQISQAVIENAEPVIADGRVTISGIVSNEAGTGVDVTWPATARYMVPFVQTFGADGVTDIDTLEWEDVTEAATTEYLELMDEKVAAATEQADRAEDEADNAEGSATTAGTQAVIATNAAASAGASANAALGTTTNSPSYKAPVYLTATTSITLSGTSQTIDGVSGYGTGVRILAVAQNDQTQNGIWVTAAGSWTRAADADDAAKIANMVTWALAGDSQYGREYRLATTETITLGTTKLPFTAREFGHSQSLQRDLGTAVIVGDSNRNGRVAYYTNLPLELTGVGRPLQAWTFYNMAQNGSQLHGWRGATEASSLSGAPAPADYTGITNPYTNLYQVCKAAPDLVLFSLGINDFNSPANRSGNPGLNFGANLDWAMNFLLVNNSNRDSVIVLEVPAPYGSLDFESGGFDTDWAGDAATYGNADAAENAAYFSRVLRGHYLRWKGRNPRVIVHDTAGIFNPGSTADPTLHRCDNPKLNCLDPQAVKVRFAGSITGDVLTVTAVYGGGTLAVGYAVTTDAYGANNSRVIQSQLTGTAGGVGTYQMNAGSDVAATVLKIPSPLIDDSLHFSGNGARRIIESFSRQSGVEARRPMRSITRSQMGTDPFYTVFQNAYWAKTFWYAARQTSGANALVSIVPSPEAIMLQGDPSTLNGEARNGPIGSLPFAELALLLADLGRIRELSNLRGNRIKMAVIGGTGTIYTPSAVALSSVGTTVTFYHVLQFNDVSLASEAASGRLLVWVEDPVGIPYGNKPVSVLMYPGTAAAASIAMPNPINISLPVRRVAATRFAATDGAMTIDVGFSNQSNDNRLVDGSISTASLPYVIGQLSFGATARAATYTPNQTNIDAAVAAGISWPAAHGTAMAVARWKSNYRLTLIPSATTTLPITVNIND